MGDSGLGPLNISVKGEYALLALFDLASHRRGEPVKIASIAARQHIPQKFLELILSQLKQGGFVESRRGADGGYFLARDGELITVGEVLRFVEGGKSARSSRRRADSPLADLWGQVESAVVGVVDKTSFASLVRQWQEKQERFVPTWNI